MRIKDALILTLGSLIIGWTILYSYPSTYKTTQQPQIDTPIIFKVKGQRALFIGDSHTANFANGWQTQLCKVTGLIQTNASKIGKTTYWMVNMAVYKLDNRFDYCFVYGGANDMYSNTITVQEAINNIKGIAKICQKLGVKCVILTGFDPIKCTRTPNVRYPYKYAEFQRMLMSQYMEGAQVVDTRVVDRRDCWDGLCHMNPEGHRKIAEKVINDLKFQKL